jgi:flagellar assembly factor FliW
MTFDRAASVYMPRGLLGYAEFHDFALANLPDPKLTQFKLLQSLTEPSLSFVVAPINLENEMIDFADIDAACRALSVAPADAAVLLVVATRRIGDATQISVNLRAPVIVDTRNQTAWQHILSNHRYPVRHVVGMSPSAAG